MAKITDKTLDMLFSEDLKRILGTSILRSEDRGYALGLAILHKLIVEQMYIDDDKIDRNEYIVKLILNGTIAMQGAARKQLVEMLQTQNTILTMGELEKDRKVIK